MSVRIQKGSTTRRTSGVELPTQADLQERAVWFEAYRDPATDLPASGGQINLSFDGPGDTIDGFLSPVGYDEDTYSIDGSGQARILRPGLYLVYAQFALAGDSTDAVGRLDANVTMSGYPYTNFMGNNQQSPPRANVVMFSGLVVAGVLPEGQKAILNPSLLNYTDKARSLMYASLVVVRLPTGAYSG